MLSSAPCLVNSETHRLNWTYPCFKKLGFLGGSSGLLSGLLGIGGGIIIVPGMTASSDIKLHSIIATSLMVVAFGFDIYNQHHGLSRHAHTCNELPFYSDVDPRAYSGKMGNTLYPSTHFTAYLCRNYVVYSMHHDESVDCKINFKINIL